MHVYCDDQRLTTREGLELLVPVCQAVQNLVIGTPLTSSMTK
jgi:hypothetical protein